MHERQLARGARYAVSTDALHSRCSGRGTRQGLDIASKRSPRLATNTFVLSRHACSSHAKAQETGATITVEMVLQPWCTPEPGLTIPRSSYAALTSHSTTVILCRGAGGSHGEALELPQQRSPPSRSCDDPQCSVSRIAAHFDFTRSAGPSSL
jgi:hypothetical protein